MKNNQEIFKIIKWKYKKPSYHSIHYCFLLFILLLFCILLFTGKLLKTMFYI